MTGNRYESVKLAPEDVSADEDCDIHMSATNRTAIYGAIAKSIALIAVYFVPSIGLTFYQRWFLKDFEFPLTVVLCHLMLKFVCAFALRIFLSSITKSARGVLTKNSLEGIVWTGIASGVDIGFSNWGLHLVHVSMYSMTKSTTVIFILICAIMFKLERKSWSQVIIVSFISGGLCLFTYKAQAFNEFGFILLIIASMASGVRWTCAQLLLQKNSHINSPLDMIYVFQPWMIASVLPLAIFIEGPKLLNHLKNYHETESSHLYIRLSEILFGAAIAFILEFTEFLVVTYTSSLTLSIAGIVKEIIILVMAVMFNKDHITTVNFFGLVFCLCGIISHALYKLKRFNGVVRDPVKSVDARFSHIGQRTPLIESDDVTDQEDSDSQIIFNILNSRD